MDRIEAVRKAEEQDAKEAEERRERRGIFERAFQRAGIPARFVGCSLSSYPVSAATAPLLKRLRCPLPPHAASEDDPAWDAYGDAYQLWKGSWFFHGLYGRGKTGLVVSYAREWLRDLCDTETPEYLRSCRLLIFASVPDLLSELRDTYRSNASERDVIRRYTGALLLLLDDLGAEHVKDAGWLEDRLYQIIGTRHAEERPTLFTSNLNLEQLAGKIGERVTWRIVEMCGADHIVKVDGPNLRDR